MKAEEVKKEIQAVFQRAEKTGEKKQILIGIDGMCGSGKTSLCAELQKSYEFNLFHMDDFFLRPEQRTRERLAQIGGNVDYERFQKEVLEPLEKGKAFTYRPFSCQTMELCKSVPVEPRQFNIIEGAYCCHPYFGQVYDYIFFVDIEEEEQKKRLLKRSGPELYERFRTEWIPKENAYFEAYPASDVKVR